MINSSILKLVWLQVPSFILFFVFFLSLNIRQKAIFITRKVISRPRQIITYTITSNHVWWLNQNKNCTLTIPKSQRSGYFIFFHIFIYRNWVYAFLFPFGSLFLFFSIKIIVIYFRFERSPKNDGSIEMRRIECGHTKRKRKANTHIYTRIQWWIYN